MAAKGMSVLFVALLISMLAGQLAGISWYPGITIYLHDMVLVLFLLFALVSHHKRIPPLFLIKPQLAVIAAALLSLIAAYSTFPFDALVKSSLYLVRWVGYAALMWALVASGINAWSILYGLYGTSVAFAALGIIQYLWYPDLRNLLYLGWDPHYQRVFGTLLDPNFMGIILTMGALLGLGLLTRVQKMSWVILVTLVIIIVALLFTFSRSSFLSFIVGLATWAILMKRGRLVTGVTMLFLVALLLVPKTGEGQNLVRQASVFARVDNAGSAMVLFSKHPIFGVGFDTLRLVQCLESGCIGEGGSVSRAAGGVDNSLLFVLVTMGVIGGAAFIWLGVALAQLGGRVYRLPRNRVMGASFFAIFLAVLAHGQFVNSLFYPWVMLWIWAYVAAMLNLTVDK